MVARVDAAFRDRFELSVADAELLFLLSLSEVPPRVVELSNRVLMSQSSVSRALAALDARGLVARTSSEQDGRATHVMLTPAGRALVRELRGLEESVLDQYLFAYLDDAAVESLLEVWRRLPWLTVDVAQVGEWALDEDRGKDVAPRRRPRRPLVEGD
jgi:DNA-binding MarR family transcriptional regulator